MTHVIVLGSLNMDTVVRLARRPELGETVIGRSISRSVGGKGLNQAVAAARAGAPTAMIGALGEDAEGAELRGTLSRQGVDATRVRTMAGQTSGHAWITVTDDGENTIVVVPGANAALDRGCAAAVDDFPSGSVLLCQLEVPLDVVHAAARTAEAHGVRLILNASPSAAVPPDLLALCDPLVVNHREATRLLGRDLPDAEVPRDASDLSAELLGMGARSVVVTLGAAGAAWHDPNGYLAVPAPRVRAVDTTGAGDAFAGTLAAQLLRATSAEQALAAAVAAGSEATTWQGAHG